MKNNPNKTSSQLKNVSSGVGTSNCHNSDSLLFLIYKIEAVSDWIQSWPNYRKIENYVTGALFAMALIWGAFFVPSDILAKSVNARSWVEIATTLFPWISKLTVNWGVAAEKQVYLQSVYILVGTLPTAIICLSGWTVRVNHKCFSKKLDEQIWKGPLLILMLFGVIWNDTQLVDHYLNPQKTFRLFMLNPYFSAIGAFLCAWGTILPIILVPLSLLYVIQFFRLQIKQFLG